MIQIVESLTFIAWIEALRDRTARTRIVARLRRLQLGNAGDIRPVGGGVSELRIHYGPGYRVYLTQRGETFIVLLCGGDKGTQAADIARARLLARERYDAE